MSLELDLQGRRALVTGAGQGVGRAIAHGLAGAGAEVVVNDVDGRRAAEVVEEIVDAGELALAAVFDVTDFGQVADASSDVGGIDILINNAGNGGVEGIVGRGPFAESDPADWEPYLRVNLYGVLHVSRVFLPGMVASGWGRIITVVSDSGRTGDAYLAAYSAAKAGAAGFTRAVARENGRHGITVNNIALGTMRTPLSEPLWADAENEQAKAILANYVVRRPGVPEDAVGMTVFLASDHASWITGQTYPLNGGYSFAM